VNAVMNLWFHKLGEWENTCPPERLSDCQKKDFDPWSKRLLHLLGLDNIIVSSQAISLLTGLTKSYRGSVGSNRGTNGRYLLYLCAPRIIWVVRLNRMRDFSLFPSGSLLKRTWVISFNKLNSLTVYRRLHATLTSERQIL
jgi:hypothetical protein